MPIRLSPIPKSKLCIVLRMQLSNINQQQKKWYYLNLGYTNIYTQKEKEKKNARINTTMEK
jgi:hypothetical protein